MKSTNETPKNYKPLVISIVLVWVVLFTIAGLYVYYTETANAKTIPTITTVENIFLDVNGDGLVDLLVQGEVIFNSPPQPAQESNQ